MCSSEYGPFPPAARAAFFAGMKEISPILIGVAPFGAITGISVVGAGVDPVPAAAMSVIVFAGAAQLAVADLIGKNAPFAIIVFTALIINLRFLMYSASLAPYFTGLQRPWRLCLAYLLTDQAYALSIVKFSENREFRHRRWYYLGCGLALWVAWQISTVAGVLLGLRAPEEWSLEFAVPLTFMALLFPSIKDKAAAAAAVSSGVLAVAGIGLPLNTGIVVAAASGILIGFFVEKAGEKRSSNES